MPGITSIVSDMKYADSAGAARVFTQRTAPVSPSINATSTFEPSDEEVAVVPPVTKASNTPAAISLAIIPADFSKP